MRYIQIQNETRPLSYPFKAAFCSSFASRFRGLMFAKNIDPHEGVLLDEGSESKVNTTIHMFFMNFDIAAIWLDKNGTVVDARLARRWRPYYAPASPARYVLETHSSRLSDFQVGDRLVFTDAA